jgi:cytoskeletal protein CcmA (bactofilin family)
MAGSAASLSVLAADTHLTGSVTSDGDLHIDGIVNGDVTARSVSLGPAATVIGTVAAAEIVLAGTCHGALRAETVTLRPTARVHGEIICRVLKREPGAVFEAAGFSL